MILILNLHNLTKLALKSFYPFATQRTCRKERNVSQEWILIRRMYYEKRRRFKVTMESNNETQTQSKGDILPCTWIFGE